MSSACGDRKFYSLPDDFRPGEIQPAKCQQTQQLVQYIDANVIGRDATFIGPYGRRRVVYCDYTASGRSLSFIEEFIANEVLPCYGNTHTTTSNTSLQSTLFRHEARDIFRNAVNASEHDAVIFAGHGCTGAVHKLIHGLALAEPPVVFVGACEHHSNLLPWREAGALVVRVPETKEGHLDLLALETQLQAHQPLRRQMIGCFSAASNVTGVLADDVATTLLLHQYGALAFWDYATAAPYVKMDMNPLLNGAGESSVNKDAIFFSVHKFVGGVQTPGVLIAKKDLFRRNTPNGCGGGTVFFVTKGSHRYLQDVELREEGGTAAIVESVRAGLVMQLKENVGVLAIMEREEHIVKTVMTHIKTVPELLLLGPGAGGATTGLPQQQPGRLPIFSFLVRHPRGTFLHHNFVCTVLNDVFGVQARGGCACAGPYAQDLLGIDEELANQYENILLEDSRLDRTHLRRREECSGYEMLRPGFARISLPYFMADEEVVFVLEALKMVALEGWKLLPQYILNPETGEWRHRSNLVFKDRRWLGSINYADGKMNYQQTKKGFEDPTLPTDYADILETARNIFNKARKMAQRLPLADQSVLFDERAEKLRWFMLPSEAQDLLLGRSQKVKQLVPFEPACYEGSRASPVPPLFNSPTPQVIVDSVQPPLTCSSPIPSPCSPGGGEINFALGEIVDPLNLMAPNLNLLEERVRASSFHCSTSAATSPYPSLQLHHQQRNCSSQTNLDMSNDEMAGAAQNPEVLRAYVKEVTAELTAEIKSEIREVISQVQDVLDDSETSDECCRPRSGSMSLKSAEEVAEYLLEASHKLASEMKSELREVVSAVDVLISEDDGKKPPSPALLSPQPPRRYHPLNNNSTSTPSLSTPTDFNAEPSSIIRAKNSAAAKASQAKERAKSAQANTSDDSGINDVTDHPKVPRRKVAAEGACPLVRRRKFDPKEIQKSGWHCPSKLIWKPTIEAIRDFGMIRDGDKVLVCLSGGKDSLSLLHTMHQYQFYARSKGVNFQMGAVTVDPGSSSYDPRPLIPYLKSLGVPYFYEEQRILDKASELKEQDACKSICSFCSRMKRGRLYAAARREGYNVLALGQHLDDLSESFMMSVFHNGRMRTMKAHYNVKERDLRVIRPFAYVRERNLRQFAESLNLPVIPENCPACFEAPKERHRTKQLLAQQEILFPRLFWSLKSAMMPLMSVQQTGVEGKLYSRPLQGSFSSTDCAGSEEDEDTN